MAHLPNFGKTRIYLKKGPWYVLVSIEPKLHAKIRKPNELNLRKQRCRGTDGRTIRQADGRMDRLEFIEPCQFSSVV